MDFVAIVVFVLIGLVTGSVSGVMGIGGGVLLVPALMWLCGFEARKAADTSLAILTIGLPGAWLAAWLADQIETIKVDLPAALWIAGAFTIGVIASRGLESYIPAAHFRLAFGLLMIYIAARFMLSSSSEAAIAAAGLTGALVAWLAFLGLKLLGRRHQPPANLTKMMQEKGEQGWGDIDYHI
jgi:uncharacterized protein